jgi:hypothetical protein
MPAAFSAAANPLRLVGWGSEPGVPSLWRSLSRRRSPGDGAPSPTPAALARLSSGLELFLARGRFLRPPV